MTTLPGLQVLVAFQNNANDDPQTFTSIVDGRTVCGGTNVWTDITSFVAGGSGATTTIGRGRQHELARFESGQVNLILNNNDGRFNPWNTQSLYYPFLTPMVPIQVRATVAGIRYNRFTGQVNAWPTRWPDPLSAWGEIQANDAFRIFNLTDLPTSVYYQAVFADSPDLWFRLGDAAGSTKATSTAPGPFTSGTPGTAAISGGVSGGQTGLLAYDSTTSIHMDGTGVVDFGSVSPASGDFSVEMWVKASLPSSGSQNVNIVGQGAGANGWGLYYNISSKTLNFLTPLGAANINLDLTTGALHHLVVTYDGVTTVAFYVDGSPAGTPTVFGSSNPVVLVGDLQFGAAGAPFGGSNPASNYVGYVQDFAIYDTQLGTGQVFAHFDAGTRALAGGGAGAAVGWAAAAAGWPPSAVNLQNGATVFAAVQPGTAAKALSFMQQCEVTEDGGLFVDGGGLLTFVDRTGILTDVSRATPQVVFGDISGLEVAYDPGPDNALDELDVYNSVTVTRSSGVAQNTVTPPSIATFGQRDLNLSTSAASDVDSLYLSQALADRYANPVQRLRSIQVNLLNLSTAEQQAVLGLDLLQRVIVNRWGLPGGTSSPFTTEALIERIDEQITADSYVITFALSPINATRYWVLGDPVFGVLGSTTKLANGTMGPAVAPGMPCGPPTSVFVDGLTGTSATLHWQEPLNKGSAGIAFDVVQLLAGGQVVGTFPVTAPAASYTFTGLSPAANYQATVYSTGLFGSTGQPAKPPVNFTTLAGTGTSLTAPNAGLVAMKAPAGKVVSKAGTVVAGGVAVTQMLAPTGLWGIGGTVVQGSAAATVVSAPAGTVVSAPGTSVTGKVAATAMSAPAGAVGGGSGLTAPNAGNMVMSAPAGTISGGTVGGTSSQTIQGYWVGQIWAGHPPTPTEVQNFGSGGGNAFSGVPSCIVSIQPQQSSSGANGGKTDGGSPTFSIPQLKSATSGNPNMRIYRYQNGSHITGVDTGDPLWAPGTAGNPATPVAMTQANQAALEASYYRYNSAGAKVSGSWGPDLSNPSSPGLRTYRAAAAVRDVADGYDGCFLDSCGTDAPGYKNVDDPNVFPYTKPAVGNFLADTFGQAGYMNGAHGMQSTGTTSPDIIVNGLSSVDVYKASGGGATGTSTITSGSGNTSTPFAVPVYTAMCEQYLRFPSTACDATGFPGGTNNPYNGGYADWIAMVHDVTATKGGRFHGMVKCWLPLSTTGGSGLVTAAQRDQWFRVGVAVILMGYTGVNSAAVSLTCGVVQTGQSGPHDTDALSGYPILTLALGQPSSPNVMGAVVDVPQGGLWRRAFTNGIVLFNPGTATVNHALPSGGPTYVSQVGSTPGTALAAGTSYPASSTVPVPPNDALFLLGH